jgi:hypothetical protein
MTNKGSTRSERRNESSGKTESISSYQEDEIEDNTEEK